MSDSITQKDDTDIDLRLLGEAGKLHSTKTQTQQLPQHNLQHQQKTATDVQISN